MTWPTLNALEAMSSQSELQRTLQSLQTYTSFVLRCEGFSAGYHINHNNKPCLVISSTLYYVGEGKVLQNGEWSEPSRRVSLGAASPYSAGNR